MTTSPGWAWLLLATLVSVPAVAKGGGDAPSSLPAEPTSPRRYQGWLAPPLVFEPNLGQAPLETRFLARNLGFELLLRPHVAVLRTRSASDNTEPAAVELEWVGGRPQAQLSGEDLLPGRSHYYLGPSRRSWRADVPHYGRVRVGQVYPGVDVLFHGRNGPLEYDLELAAGVDPETISIRFRGADSVTIGRDGTLRLANLPGRGGPATASRLAALCRGTPGRRLPFPEAR